MAAECGPIVRDHIVGSLRHQAKTFTPWGVLVAGGSGARFGGFKQLAMLGDRRVIDHSAAALRSVCIEIVVVAPPEVVDGLADDGFAAIVPGGATRSESVRAGLSAVADSATHILVHDAARPLASGELCQRVADALRSGAVAAIPVVPITDSLRTIDGEPVDRARFVAVQTPQGFERETLRQAHGLAETATDDATLVDRLGLSVVHVKGEPTNIKITEPHDLHVAEVMMHGS